MAQTKIGAETGLAPVLTLLSKPLRSVEAVSAGFTDRSHAVEENKILREELYALREEVQRAAVMEMKLKRFEQILGAQPGLDIPAKKIAARAVSEIEGPFVRSALLNSGYKAGIQKGHPVMTVNGLYGHVLRAGPNSARVLLLGDLNSRVSVMSERSEARAILSGNNSNTPRLAFVEDRADWREGDNVLSSGDDGVLPQGLPIGVVKRSEEDGFTVVLHTAGTTIDWVWVYPYVSIAAPEEVDIAADEIAEETETAEAASPQAGTP